MINITQRNTLFLFRSSRNMVKFLLKRNIASSSRADSSNMTLQSNNINSEKINFTNEINNEPTKLVKVSLIGLPNAGKSSIINKIAGRMICPASSKVHTTQKKWKAIITEENSQIVFLDTPGVVGANESKKHHLNKEYMVDGEKSLLQADIVGIVHDVSNKWTRESLDPKVLRLIYLHSNKHFILILNKVDLLKSKRQLLELVRLLTCDSLDSSNKVVILPNLSESQVTKMTENQKGWPAFSHVFMISALQGTGVQDLKEYLKINAKPSPFLYSDPHEFTDQSPETLIIETTRAKLLEFLPQEIPYNLKTEIEYLHISEEGSLVSCVIINCSTPRIEKLIVGQKGRRVREIAQSVEQELSNTFQCPVHIRLQIQGFTENKITEQKI